MYFCITLPSRQNQKLSQLLSKGFESSLYQNEYKRKIDKKNTANEFRSFLKSNLVGVNTLFFLVYTNHSNNAKRINARKVYLPKDIIKNFNVIINEKNFYRQHIDSDIKRYEEI